ncbi:MAG: hypothetical protein H6922_03175 [Pseudomonadaceae bacterium]|nr:hypothetical protein [Pseudomonadaceae bacterium]
MENATNSYTPPVNPFLEAIASRGTDDFPSALRAGVIFSMRRSHEKGKMWSTSNRAWQASVKDVLRPFNGALVREGMRLQSGAAFDNRHSVRQVRGAIIHETNMVRMFLNQKFSAETAKEQQLLRGVSWLRGLYKTARSAPVTVRQRELHVFAQLVKLVRDETLLGLGRLDMSNVSAPRREALQRQQNGITLLLQHCRETLQSDIENIQPAVDWAAYARNIQNCVAQRPAVHNCGSGHVEVGALSPYAATALAEPGRLVTDGETVAVNGDYQPDYVGQDFRRTHVSVTSPHALPLSESSKRLRQAVVDRENDQTCDDRQVFRESRAICTKKEKNGRFGNSLWSARCSVRV